MKSDESLFEAAIESAHIFNNAVREVAQTSGLLGALSHDRSVDDIVRLMDFRPDRADQLQHLLRVLVAEGLVEEREQAGLAVFRADEAATRRLLTPRDNGRYQPRADMIAPWFGDGHADRVRAANKQMLGADLSFLRSSDAAIKFNREYELAWRTNLQNPLYEFGRMRCVRELAKRGNRFLDLACGPGYGAQRLAEFTEGPSRILCVDKSTDFLAMARMMLYPRSTVTFVERDLNTGLPPCLPESFDGILFNGAFHFIQDKATRLREMWRALRPGGLLALGHCFSHSGFADQSMHDFYFSLIDDRAYVLPWSRVKELVVEVGFVIDEEFHRGSHSYLLAERPVTATPLPGPSELVDIEPQLRGGR
jgi:ubiquinone/menaquinone biosynthesis C-methylase UbiE